jgi:hypothetical protein
MEPHIPLILKNLNGKKLDGYTLHLGEVKQLRLSGWKGFTLYLQDSQGVFTKSPVIRGIFSIGGKDGVKPWMDLQYWEQLECAASAGGSRCILLSSHGLDRRLFHYLGDSIPGGGHLMISYEDDQKIHNDTLRSLNLGIPPAATSLGFLLFLAGFQHIKNWYLSEGGYEGPRKLWGEKAINEPFARAYLEATGLQIHTFLEANISSDYPEYEELKEAARKRSKVILGIIQEKLR